VAISKRLRFEILRRDNHTCRYCGGSAPDVKLRIDHVLPEALGGSDDPSNLVTSCEPCNSGKSSIAPDSPLVEDVKQDALRWARAMEIARRGAQAERDTRDGYRQIFKDAWDGWTVLRGGQRISLPLPADWPLAVDSFVAAGLDDEDLVDAIDQSMRRKLVTDKYRYFCGVAWNMIRQRTETARILAPLCEPGDTDDAQASGEPWDF
jgi:hypothetical protein